MIFLTRPLPLAMGVAMYNVGKDLEKRTLLFYQKTRLASPLEELTMLAHHYCMRYVQNGQCVLTCIHISENFECPTPLQDSHCVLFVVQPEEEPSTENPTDDNVLVEAGCIATPVMLYFPKVHDVLPLPDITFLSRHTPTLYLFFLFS